MDWKCGPSGRVPALEALSPKYKLQSYSPPQKTIYNIYVYVYILKQVRKCVLSMCKAQGSVPSTQKKKKKKKFTSDLLPSCPIQEVFTSLPLPASLFFPGGPTAL
jgi:hypothetical protein